MQRNSGIFWKAYYSNALRGALCKVGYGILAIATFPPVIAHALPQGGQVSGGHASIVTGTNQATINQSSQRAVIDWNSFNVGSDEAVRFNQPSVSSITLNRINAANPSQINGQLSSNGQVWLVNPNGVMFGKQAQVNVGGLLATTAGIDNSRFMNGDYTFNHAGNPDAVVENDGKITVAQSGLAALVAPSVINKGTITAKLGKVQLASGDTFALDLYGDGLLTLQASPAMTHQLVSNSGTINADGGTVTLTTAAAQTVVNSLINMDGLIEADSVGAQRGQVKIFSAGSNAVTGNVQANKGKLKGNSEVRVSGTIRASGKKATEKGGAITVTADNVALLSGSVIDASGDAGGGTIKIGGDFHGQGDTPTALHAIVQAGVEIIADALTSGNGGSVAVWADEWTNFSGIILARAGALFGNGGFVETSGKQSLSVGGKVDASAPHGNAGTWLLDPDDATISSSTTTNPGYSTNWTAGSGGGNISTSDIDASLDLGTSVNITASGSITVQDNISTVTTGSPILSLTAGTDIIVNNGVSIAASGTGSLNLLFDTYSAGSGSITMGTGSSISTNGGYIHFYSHGNQSLGAINAGNIVINAYDSTSDITLNDAVTSNGDIQITSGRYLTQQAGASVTSGAAGGISLVAAGNNVNGTGTLTLDDNLSVGNNGLWLVSGLDGSGNRIDEDLSTGNLTFQSGSTAYVASEGFKALTFPNLTLTGVAYLNGYSVVGAMYISNYGNLTLGSVSSTSTSPDAAIKLLASGATSDITLNDAITGKSDVYINAGRNLTQEAGADITTGSAGSLAMVAANGHYTGTGTLTLGANLSVGTGGLWLVSGLDGGGNRIDEDLSSGNLTFQGANTAYAWVQGFKALTLPNLSLTGSNYNPDYGADSVRITSYGNLTLGSISSTNTSIGNGDILIGNSGATSDVTLNGAITGGTNVSVTAGRNLTQEAGANITSGSAGGIFLQAAGGNINSNGQLSLGANLSVGTGGLWLMSGTDGSGNRLDEDLTTGDLTFQSGTTGGIQIRGFHDLTVPGLVSSTSIDLMYNSGTNTVQDLTAAADISMSSGDTALSGSAGVTRTINAGTGTLYLGNIDAGNRNLALVGDAISLNGNLTGTGTLSIAPSTATTTMGIGSGAGTLSLSSTALGYIQSGFSSVTFGNANTGGINIQTSSSLLASAATYFISGGNITLHEVNSGDSIGAGDNAVGTLNLTDTMLNHFTVGSGKTLTIGDTSAGNIDINTASTFLNTGNVAFVSGGNIALDSAGDVSPTALTKSAGGETALTMQAAGDITLNNSITASGTGNKLDVVLDAAWVPSGAGTAGAIDMNSGSGIASNGGSITMGGGSDPTQYAAIGDGFYASGINLNNATLDAGNGNIALIGTGSAGASNNHFGIELQAGAIIQTSGNGTITATGTGGGTLSSGFNYGIYLTGSNTRITGTNGNISLTGTGGNTTGGMDRGILLDANTVVESKGTGNIALTGYGNGNSNYDFGIQINGTVRSTASGGGGITLIGYAGDFGGNASESVYGTDGVLLEASTISSVDGAIVIDGNTGNGHSVTTSTGDYFYGVALEDGATVSSLGTAGITLHGVGAGAGSNNAGIFISRGSNVIGGGLDSGAVNLIADAISLSNFSVQTTGNVTIAPHTASTLVGFGGTNPTGTLQVTQAVMDAINAPTVTVGSTGAGTLTTNAFNWEHTLTNLNLVGNSIEVSGNITKGIDNGSVANTGNGTLTLKSSSNIVVDSGAGISSTSSYGKLNTVFDADSQGSHSGYINMGYSSSIATNGGDIYIGGGSLDGSGHPTGAAWGNSGQADGIYFVGSSLSASDGNVALTGHGYASGTGLDCGIDLYEGSISTTGLGNIIFNGTGGGTGGTNIGVYLESASGTLSTVDGNITITGQGSSSGTTHGNTGAAIFDNIAVTGTGNITITGTDGGSGGASGDGVAIGVGTISATSGAISIVGSGHDDAIDSYNSTVTTTSGPISLVSSSPGGLIYWTYGGHTFGGTSETGNISVQTDQFTWTGDGSLSFQTTGSATFAPYTTDGSVSVGFGGTNPTGTLKITQADMDAINAPTVIVGSTGAGTLTTDTFNWENTLTNLNLIGNNVTVGGAMAMSNSGTNSLALQANNDIMINSAITASTGKLNTLFDSNYANLNSGYVQVNANITTNGGNLTIGGGSGTITGGTLNADGTIHTAATGYAWDNGDGNSLNQGVLINDNVVVNTGAGNVIINGHGYGGALFQSDGVDIGHGSYGTLQTTSGNITINGTGGGGFGDFSDGIYVAIAYGSITTASGAITLNGTGGPNSGYYNSGVEIGGSVSSTGTGTGLGAITINGTGGSGGGGYNFGIYSDGGGLLSNGANVILNGTAGGGYYPFGVGLDQGVTMVGAGNITINSATGGLYSLFAAVGGSSDTGDITLNQNSVALFGSAFNTSGTVTIAPYTTDGSVNIGFGGTSPTGNLQVTQAVMDAIHAPTIIVGSTTSGLLTTDTFNWENTLQNLSLIGNNITVGGAMAMSNSGTNNLTVQANNDIIVNSAITASTGKLNALFDSNYANLNSGYVQINGNVTTNGGNLTIGGGSGTITSGSGYAWDNGDGNSLYAGVVINDGVTVNTGAGNIVMNGEGNGGNAGLDIGRGGSGATIETTTGNIAINGVGNTAQSGISIQDNSTITTTSGAINLTGVGGNMGFGLNDGINNYFGTISSTGTGSGLGAITLNGTGGTVGFGNLGVYDSGFVSTNDANIIINGTGGSNNGGGIYVGVGVGASGAGNIILNSITGSFYGNNNGFIGGVSDTGNVTLNQDSAVWGGIPIYTKGTVTIAPYTTDGSASIGFGGTNPAGGLQVTQAAMDTIDAPTVIIGSTTSALLTTDTFNWEHTLQNLSLIGNNIVIGGSITKGIDDGSVANTTDATLTLQSNRNIVVNPNATISSSSTYGKLNSLFDADYDTLGTGYISFADNAVSTTVIASNGGTITLGGGNGTINAGSGYAVGSSTNGFQYGIYLGDRNRMDAGGGNIVMNGMGGTYSSGNNYGIYFPYANVIATSGSGTVTLYGTGGTGSTNNIGLDLENFGTTIQATGTGNIVLNGTGGDGGSGGVYLYNGALVQSADGDVDITGTGVGSMSDGHAYGVAFLATEVQATGTGNININGTAGANPADHAYGIGFFGETLLTNGGNITVTGTNPGASNGITFYGGGTVSTNTIDAGSGQIDFINHGNSGIYVDSATIGAASGAGNITFQADALNFNSNYVVQSAGDITFKPYTSGITVGVGSGNCGSSCGLNIPDALLGNLTFGHLTIGSTTTGAMDIDSAYTFAKPVTFQTGNSHDITVDGQITDSASGVSGPAAVVIASGGNFINTYGSSVFNLTGSNNPRWLIYSTHPAGNTLDGLVLPTAVFSKTYAGYAPSSVTESGNAMFYANAPLGTITYTANDASMGYSSTTPAFTYRFNCSTGCTEAQAETGGTLSLTSAGNSSTNAGTYGIVAAQGSLIFNGAYADYLTTYVDGTLTIGKAHLTVTADGGKSMVYGAGSLPALTDTITGYLNNDGPGIITGGTVSLTTAARAYNGTAGSGSNAGTYDINASGNLTATNYDFTYVNAINGLTVTKAVLTATADHQSRAAGTANPIFTETISGYRNGDTSNIISGSANGSSAADNATGAGNYTITATTSGLGLASGDNYIFAASDGLLTITAPLFTPPAIPTPVSPVVPASVINPPALRTDSSNAPIPPASSPLADPVSNANSGSNINLGSNSDNSTGNTGNTVNGDSGNNNSAKASSNSGNDNAASTNGNSSSKNGSNTSNPAAGKSPSVTPARAPIPIPANINPRNFGNSSVYRINDKFTDPAPDGLQPVRGAVDEVRTFSTLTEKLDALESPESEQSQVIKRIIVPGAVAVSVMSLSYMLLFSRAIYATIASIGMTSVRHRLDPAALLEYWEGEGKERSIAYERDKNMESMFG